MHLRFLDIAKALGIILVVFGHYAPTTWYEENWFAAVRFIYRFHMPLFFFLSGYLLSSWTESGRGFTAGYRAHVGKKALRLLVPYATISVFYIGMKVVGGSLFAYNPITPEALRDIFLYPPGGPADLAWFVYVLFLVVAIAPLVLRVSGSSAVALCVSLPLAALPWPELFCLDRVFRFLPIFLLGQLFRRHGLLQSVKPTVGLISAAGLLAVAVWATPKQFLYAPLSLALLQGAAGSLVVVFLALFLEQMTARTRVLEWLGSRSLVIYLFHQPLTWAPAVVLYTAGYRGYELLWGLLPGLALGLFIPALAQDLVISRSRLLSFLVLGDRGALPSPAVSSDSDGAHGPARGSIGGPAIDTGGSLDVAAGPAVHRATSISPADGK